MAATLMPNVRHERPGTSKRSAAGERSARWRGCARGRPTDSKQTCNVPSSHCPPRRACGPAQPDGHDGRLWLHYAKRFTRVQLLRQHAGTAIKVSTLALVRRQTAHARAELSGEPRHQRVHHEEPQGVNHFAGATLRTIEASTETTLPASHCPTRGPSSRVRCRRLRLRCTSAHHGGSLDPRTIFEARGLTHNVPRNRPA